MLEYCSAVWCSAADTHLKQLDRVVSGFGTLDRLMTDVPDLAQVSVVAPIGNSDHSSLSTVISMAQAVPNLCVSRKVFLKHQVNWNMVCGAMQIYPGVTFGLLTILLRF